jgi:hypothetical protein
MRQLLIAGSMAPVRSGRLLDQLIRGHTGLAAAERLIDDAARCVLERGTATSHADILSR